MADRVTVLSLFLAAVLAAVLASCTGSIDSHAGSGGDASVVVTPDANPSAPDANPSLPDAAPPTAPARGANVPWIEYEAEAGLTNGTTLAPSRRFGDFAAESSGRRAVRLDATGQFVSFVRPRRLVLRPRCRRLGLVSRQD